MSSVKILALFRSQFVDADSPVGKFAVGHLIVDFTRYGIQHLTFLAADGFLIVHQVFGAEGLNSE